MSKLSFLISFLSILLFVGFAKAQDTIQRISGELNLYSTLGTNSIQSFWITHNRYGVFGESTPSAVLLPTVSMDVRPERMFDLGGGIGLLGRASNESTVYLHEAYLEAKLGFVRLNMGRRAKQPSIQLNELSSGSMYISSNAPPTTRIEASVPDFFEVPFTFGWVEFRGHFSHAWLNDDRYVTSPYLHDKSLHIQTGGNTGLKFYWGISHAAIWGGESDVHGELPSSFSDFFRVLVAKEGASGAPANEVNALGFHTGTWDWGLSLNLRRTQFQLYYQHLFTDASGRTHQNLGDGLFGLNIKNPFPFSWISEFTYEYHNTTDQSGPGLSDPRDGDFPDFCEERNCGFPFRGRDDYYNNTIYRSGHSYQGYSLGSPFFLTRPQLERKFPDAATFHSVAFFISNRNRAHHVGIRGFVSENLEYKVLASYVRYFGTYTGLNLGQSFGYFDPANRDRLEEYFFNPPRDQWYFLLETRWGLERWDKLKFTSTIGADQGDLFNSFSFLLGVSWRLIGS